MPKGGLVFYVTKVPLKISRNCFCSDICLKVKVANSLYTGIKLAERKAVACISSDRQENVVVRVFAPVFSAHAE